MKMKDELTIKMNRVALLNRLKKNKTRFAKSFKALLKAYEKRVKKFQEQYAKYAQKVKDQKVTDRDFEPSPPPKPEDRAKDYDFYIEMLQLNEGVSIEVSEAVFRRLWDDEWGWMRRHIDALNFYADDADVAE